MKRLKDIITPFLISSPVYAIEIHSSNLGEVEYRLLIAQIKNQEITKISTEIHTSLNALKEALNNQKAKAVYLLVNTRQVLEKVVSSGEQWNRANAIKQHFPSMDSDQMYIQHTLLNETALVSIIRKEHLNSLIADFTDFWVVEIGLGKTGLTSVLSFFERKDRKFRLNNELIDMSNNISISSIHPNIQEERILGIDEIRMEEKYLPLFSFLFQHLTNAQDSNTYEGITEAKENWFYYSLINKFKLPILMIFLGILLLNFWYFNAYSEKLKQYGDDYNNLIVNDQVGNKIKEKIDERKKLLNSIKGMNQTQNAQLLDSLGLSVPSGVTIKAISINPLKSYNFTSNKTIEIENNTMILQGEAMELAEVMNWYKRIDAVLYPVDKVEIEHITESDSLVFFEFNANLK